MTFLLPPPSPGRRTQERARVRKTVQAPSLIAGRARVCCMIARSAASHASIFVIPAYLAGADRSIARGEATKRSISAGTDEWLRVSRNDARRGRRRCPHPGGSHVGAKDGLTTRVLPRSRSIAAISSPERAESKRAKLAAICSRFDDLGIAATPSCWMSQRNATCATLLPCALAIATSAG